MRLPPPPPPPPGPGCASQMILSLFDSGRTAATVYGLTGSVLIQISSAAKPTSRIADAANDIVSRLGF